MKSLYKGIFVLAVLVVGMLAGRYSVPASRELASIKGSGTFNLKVPDPFIRVKRVIDGDTIELETGETVRYIGIDTPETLDPRKPVQCFGIEASRRNKELTEGKTVRLEKDVSEQDRYGRLLRYVYVGNTFVNLELVKEGFAKSYSYPPDIEKQQQFVEAEHGARESGLGLWGACPSIGSAAAEPMDGSSTNIGQTTQSADCTIKGNISASGEKIYHLIGCGSYTKTRIDAARGERWFCSETDAKSAGWRKAGNCP